MLTKLRYAIVPIALVLSTLPLAAPASAATPPKLVPTALNADGTKFTVNVHSPS